MANKHKNPEISSLLKLTWPIFVQTFLNFVAGFVDTFMLSRYSDNVVGAVGLANQIINIVILLLGMIGSGAVILISQNLGASNRKMADEIAKISVTLNLVIGLVLSIILFGFRYFILKIMNCPDDFMQYSQSYIAIVGGAMFIKAVFLIMSSVMLSYGHSKSPMIISVVVNVLNFIGNYLVIFRPIENFPEFGVAGVAASTVISQGIGTVVLYFILVKKVKIKLFGNALRYKRENYAKILKLGVTVSAEQVLYNLSQLAITFIISFIGATALSTRVYTNTIIWMTSIPVYSIGIGTQIIVARLIGEGKKETANEVCFQSLKIGLFVTTSISLIVYVCAKFIFGFFTSNEDIISLGVTLLFITIFMYPGKVFNTVIGSSLRAVGDVMYPVYLSIIFMCCISIPVAYLLGIHWKLGLAGIWLVFLGDELIRGMLMLFRWKSRKWDKKSLIKEE